MADENFSFKGPLASHDTPEGLLKDLEQAPSHRAGSGYEESFRRWGGPLPLVRSDHKRAAHEFFHVQVVPRFGGEDSLCEGGL
jgi:hypothetical protein